jgi:hypothetical protein
VLHFMAIMPKDKGSSFLANRLDPIMPFNSKADFFNIMKLVKFISCMMASDSVVLILF